MTDLVYQWFQTHLDMVYFVDGLAFISMGVAVAVYIRFKSSFKISQPLPCLVAFGILHGMNQWLDMFAIIKGNNIVLDVSCFCTLTASYLFLFEFGRRLNAVYIAGAPHWLKRVEQRNGIWMPVVLLLTVIVLAAASQTFLLVGTVCARYFLGFTGAVLSAVGIFLYYHSEEALLRSIRTRKYFYVGAAGFLLYAIIDGLVVPPATFFPADVLNNDTFVSAIRIPVQVFRALCAVVIAWSVTGVLKIFYWERVLAARRAQDEIKTLKQQMEFILGATKTGLDIIDGRYNIRYVDPAWEKIYGSYTGKKCYDYFMRKPAPCDVCGVRKALETKKIAVSEEVLVKEGNRPIQVTTIPFKDVSGEWMVAEVNVDISDRKKAEQAILESEEKYRLIVENAADPIAIVDDMGTVLMLNMTAARHLRGVPADYTGKKLSELFPKPIVDRQLNNLRRIIRSGVGEVIESSAPFPGGERWFSTRIHPATFSRSARPCALIIARDITDHKLAEQEAKKFKMIADNANYGIGMVDMQEKVIYSNASFAKMHGYDVSELMGRNIGVFHNDEQMPEVRRINRALLAGETVANVEVWHARRDGTVFPALMNVVLIRDDKHHPLFIAATAVDITDRREAEDRLKESEERYRSLIENIGIGVALISPRMEILTLNSQMRKWFPNIDIAKKPICYKSFNVPPRDTVCAYCPTRLTLADGKVHEAISETSAGDTVRNYRIVATPLFNEKGKVRSVIEMVEDITEQTQVGNKLRLFRNLLDQSNDAIFIIEPQTGQMLDVNEKACSSLGYTRTELLGMTKQDIESVFSDPPAWKRHVEEVRKKGYVLLEGMHRRKDGTLFPVDVNVKYIEQKGKAFMVAVIRDVTARKAAENALRASERKARAILDQSFGFIGLMTLDGVLIEANKSALLFAGINESDVIGKPFWETPWWTHSAELQERLRQSIKKAARGEFDRFAATHTAADGTLHYIDFSLKPVKDETGTVVFIIPEGRDITEQRHVQEALRKSEVKYHELVDTANAIILLLDRDQKIMFMNKYAEEFFGYGPDEIIGKNVIGTIVPMTDNEGRDVRAMVGEVFAHLEEHRAQENENIKKNGERVWISWANRVLRDDMGAPVGFLSVGTDFTARKQAENALRKAYADLQEMQNTLIQSEKLAALGRFSLGVAHEIKNPLGIILGGIEYLDIKMPDLPAELKETMKKIEEATVRADKIVHTLLRFARPAELKMEKVRPEDLVSETIAFLKYRAPVSNIKVVKKFMKEKVFVSVDKNQIQQVLFNLLLNAVESMPPEGGEVSIHTHKAVCKEFSDKPACVIEIVDTGAGISREHLRRMFEPFFTTKRDRKGTGLGLPVSKTIINNHKGDMVIESEEGKGTTVRVILPIAEG